MNWKDKKNYNKVLKGKKTPNKSVYYFTDVTKVQKENPGKSWISWSKVDN